MQVKLGLDSLTHDELADKADTVHAAMVTNAATFNAPDPTMPNYATHNTSFRAAIAARETAEANLKSAVLAENAAAKVIFDDTTKLGSYVQFKSGGDAVVIGLAAMGVRATSGSVGPMPKVQNVKTTTSDFAGKLDWMCSPVAGVKAYIIQICTGDPAIEANWSHADISSKSSGTLSGLTAGKIWIRVSAKGAGDNLGAPSDPAVDVVR